MEENNYKAVYSDKTLDIAEKIDQNFIIVCDTNVYLGLYRLSPDYANYALECLNRVKSSIILPYTVKIEFARHNVALFRKRQEAIENTADDLKKLAEQQKSKMINSFSAFVKRQFPEVDIIQEKIEGKYQEIIDMFTDYFDDRSVLSLLQDNWTEDIVSSLVGDLCSNGQIMTDFSRDEIYKICEEGAKRYKDNIPPGFKDGKDKDGIRKYSDLILWKEVIRYAHDNQKNIIFVTDDVKPDWWKINNGTYEFLPDLIQEFEKKSRLREGENGGSVGETLQIIPFRSVDFYEAISTSYGIEKSDAVDQALQITIQDYIQSIQDSAFDAISSKLQYSGTDYISDILTYVGSEGVDEWSIDSYELAEYDIVERINDKTVYELTYDVELSGFSYDYWGRDDDTKEIIVSPAYEHSVRGQVTIRVIRTVDIFMDFEFSDDFESVEIVSTDLEETYYKSGYDYDEDEEFVPDAYNVCPDCGKPINFVMMVAMGFA